MPIRDERATMPLIRGWRYLPTRMISGFLGTSAELGGGGSAVRVSGAGSARLDIGFDTLATV